MVLIGIVIVLVHENGVISMLDFCSFLILYSLCKSASANIYPDAPAAQIPNWVL